MFTLCIVSTFLLSRAIDRGDLRSAGVSCFIAKPLRSYRSPSLASASFGRLLSRWPTILGDFPVDQEYFTKNLWVIFRCSPGYSTVVVRLDAVCDPGVSVGTRLKRTSRIAYAYYQGIGTIPKFRILGAMGQIQSIHSSPRLTRVSLLRTGWKHYRAVDYSLPGRAFFHSLSIVDQRQVQTMIIPP